MKEMKKWAKMVLWLTVLGMLSLASRGEFCMVDSLNPDVACATGMGVGRELLQTTSAIAQGLSLSFYDKTCPQLLTIVNDRLQFHLKDRLQAAGLLRLFFHECFVQGCDGALLLNGTSSEKQAVPNLSLRSKSFEIIEDIKSRLETACPKTVSCSDIEVLAAAEATRQVGGPSIKVPLGRRDSVHFASLDLVVNTLPGPTNTVGSMLSAFSRQGLDMKDLVALSGGHSIGQVHCASLENRLRPTVDPELDSRLASSLLAACPPGSTNLVNIESSPQKFDNMYFKNLLTGDALLTSDVTLEQNPETRRLVKTYAKKRNIFFNDFANSFVKLSQLGVLTGTDGEIRQKCNLINGHTTF